MGAARQLFLSVRWITPGDEVAHGKLSQAAELWRGEGQHFSAGIAMLRAMDAAWGWPDRMLEAQSAALQDFGRVVSYEASDSPASLAALHKSRQTLTRALSMFEIHSNTIRSRVRELSSETSERLLTYFKHSEHAESYLVRGFIVTTDLDGGWTVQFPAHEPPLGTEQLGSQLIMNLPSAFNLFVSDRDWPAAYEIVKKFGNDAFTTAGVKGWRAVTLAHMRPDEAAARFDEAADAFSADTMPSSVEEMARRGSWSGANTQLWAKYFRSRARLVNAIRNPLEVRRLLAEAADGLAGTESGIHSTEVSRFRVLINALATLTSDPQSFSILKVRGANICFKCGFRKKRMPIISRCSLSQMREKHFRRLKLILPAK